MKNRTKGIITVAAILASLTAGLMLPGPNERLHTGERPSAPAAALPALQGEKAIQRLKEQGLYDSLQKAVEATRYEMRWEKHPTLRHLPPSYYAPNPAQRLNAYFTSQGLHLVLHQTKHDATDIQRSSDQAEWQAEMKLIGYGYGETLLGVGLAELVAEDNRIEYRRRGLPLTEWYVNKAEGLEQGFTIEAPPGVRPEDERLRLVLALGGDLRAEEAEEGRAIALKQADGMMALRYGDLHAYDAEGKVLPSEMKVTGGLVMLEVDERGAVYPVTIDPTFTQQQKLTASDGAARVFFGHSVAISGDTAVVGAPGIDFTPIASQGSAYMFVRSGTTWSQQQQLTASDGAVGNFFGGSVAISGDTAVVGAPGDDIGSNDYQGSAYVFVRSGTSWSEKQKLFASNGAAGDLFGRSLAISGDLVVVGAPRDGADSNGGPGSVYLFVKDGTAWSQHQKLTASDGEAGDNFGRSVAVSGATVVVGNPWDDIGSNADRGSASVFVPSVIVRGHTTWIEQQKLTASDGAAGDLFGLSVAISEDTVVVGAHWDAIGSNDYQGSAYVFVRSGTTWSQQQKLTAGDAAAYDVFGISVAISKDIVVVGAAGDVIGSNTDQGSAYVFVRSGTTWNQQQKLIASDGAAGDLFGERVAISGDAVVVGVPRDQIGSNVDQGSAYMFGTWGQRQKLTGTDGAATDRFGRSVAMSDDTVVVGAAEDDIGSNSDQGSAYVFVRSGTTWSQQQKLTAGDGAAGDNFGVSVAISGDTVVVGADRDDIGSNADQGSAYVFVRSVPTFPTWSQQAKLTAGDGAAGDQCGASVAITDDTVVVGARFDNSWQGSAYVFLRSGSTWSKPQKLTASDGAAGDQFGTSVAISGDTVVVGAEADTIGSNTAQGSAYIFVRKDTSWSERQKLTAGDGVAGDSFGTSVAISDDTVVVGAWLDDTGSNFDQGSAYIFVRSGATWSQQQRLTAGDGAAGDSFGTAVAISSVTVVVGASADDTGFNGEQGGAYVFVRSGTSWSQQAKLTASDGGAGDNFGTAVAISRYRVVVGAEGDDIGSNVDRGSVYVFTR